MSNGRGTEREGGGEGNERGDDIRGCVVKGVMGGMCCEGCVEEVGCYERGVGEGVCFEECPMSALLQAPPPPEGCIRVVLGV